MYWRSILYLLTWPALVVLAYQLVKFVVKKYKNVLEKADE